VEIVKPAGFNSPQLAALGLNLTFIDTPWLAAGKLIFQYFGCFCQNVLEKYPMSYTRME
jgi:hypothetical protein